MKRILPILLILCLLCGCGRRPAPTEPSTEPSKSVTEPTTEPTEPPTEPTTEPTEPPVLYRNPLNGSPISAPWVKRPYAVVINNIQQALPQHGVSQADMIFEILAEGGITRCLALFSDLSNVNKLGSIRSSRTYLIDLAQGHDAIFAHSGGSQYAYNQLSLGLVDNLDGLRAAGSAYYRDSDRLASGYALEHTLFTSGPDLIAMAEKMGYQLTRDEGVEYNYFFDPDITLDGERANSIVLHFGGGGKTTSMTYQPDTGLYGAAQSGRDYIDGNTGGIVSFRNVIILYAKMTSDGYRVFHETVGAGDGYFACGGVIIPIQWSRADNSSSFQFTMTDGTPVTLAVGHSYIGILPTGSPVDYE